MSNEHAIASAIIRLMQGVVYRDSDEDTWLTLERLGAGVRDHFATIGVDVHHPHADGGGKGSPPRPQALQGQPGVLGGNPIEETRLFLTSPRPREKRRTRMLPFVW